MEWKSVGFGRYSVSPCGKVRNDKTGLLLKPSTGKLGYPRVILFDNGNNMTLLIHHAVAACFIGPRPSGLVIDHIDGNKANNHVSNLRYITHAENIRKGYDGKRGNNHHSSVLTDQQVNEIRKRRANGERGADLAREFRISQQTICDIIKGRSRKGS